MRNIFHDKISSPNRDLWFFRLILVLVIFVTVTVGIMSCLKYFKNDNKTMLDDDKNFKSSISQSEEIKEKRTYNTKVYKNPDNSETMVISSDLLHFKDETTGMFEDIDITLLWNNEKHGWYFEKDNFKPFLPEYADEWVEFRDVFNDKDQTIQFKAKAKHVKGKLVSKIDGLTDWNAVVYDNAFGNGIDYILYFTPSRLEKVVRIREEFKQDIDYYFDFEIKFTDGLKIYRSENGEMKEFDLSINQVVNDDKTIFFGNSENGGFTYFLPFRMWDSQSYKILQVEFYTDNGKNFLRKKISKDFLKNSKGSVYADTTTSYSSVSGDGEVFRFTNANFNTNLRMAAIGTSVDYTSTVLGAGTWWNNAGTSYNVYRLFFPMDTSGLPDNAIISAANFNVKITNFNYNRGSITHGLIQTTQSSTSSLTTSDWPQLVINSPTEGASRVQFTTDNTWYQWVLNSSGLSWINKTGYTKLGLRSSSDIDNIAPTDSYEMETNMYFTGSGFNPYLTVTYTVPVPPTLTNLTLTPFYDGSGYVNVYTQVSDENNDNVRLKIEYSSPPCDHSLNGTASIINAIASSGTPTTSTDPYQVQGITTVSANNVTSTWNSNDIFGADGTYCVYVTPNDGTEDGVIVSTTVLLDLQAPTKPGFMSVNTKFTNAVTLNFGIPSVDNGLHFDQYKIFYANTTPVTQSDNAFTSSSDSNLGNINYNGAATTTIGSLTTNTLYYMNIWAYDTYGNFSFASPEGELAPSLDLYFYTLAPTPTNLVTSSLATSSASFSVDVFDNHNSGYSGYYFNVVKISDMSEVGNSGWQSGDNTWSINGLTPYTNYRASVKYRNGDEVETSVITYDFRTLDITPLVPAISSLTSSASDSVTVILDPNNNVTSTVTFSVHDSVDNKYLQVGGTWDTGEAWLTYFQLGESSGIVTTGLLPNTQHTVEARAKSESGEITAFGSSQVAYTLANVPSSSTVTASSTVALNLIINPNSNPDSTEYYICQTTDNSSCAANGYVQAGGNLGASEIWRSYTLWGGVLGTYVVGLNQNSPYKFLTKARNGDNTETASLSDVSSEVYTLTAVPTGIAAAKDGTNNTSQINVFWDSSTSTAYQVGYGTSSWLTNPTFSTTWDSPLYAYVSSLSANTTYYFRVRARNANSVETEWSDEVIAATDNVVTDTTPPSGGWGGVVLSGSITINNNAVSTSERNVLVILDSNEAVKYYGPVEAVYNSSTGQFSTCNFSGVSETSISLKQINYTLSADNGPKRLCVKFDTGNGSTLEKTANIILDQPIVVPTTVESIVVNKGGEITNTSTVSVVIESNTAIEYVLAEGVYDVVNKRVVCNLSALPYQAFVTGQTKNLVLSSGFGTKAVCAHLKDATGDRYISDTIEFQKEKKLLVHLTFDEKNSAGSFNDFSPFNWKVECSGTSCPNTLEAGLRGQAAYFDGVDDNVYIKRNTNLVPTEQISIVAWIKPESTSNENYDYMWVVDKSIDYELFITKGGSVIAGIRNQNLLRKQAISANNFFMQKWNQIALTYDGQKVKAFSNGKQIAEKEQTGLIGKTLYDLRIGGLLSGASAIGKYRGLIDDVKVYDYSLTAKEIEDDFLLNPNTEYTGPIFFDFESINDKLVSDKANKFLARCNPVERCPQVAPGKFGNGLFFDGVDDQLQILNSADLNGGNGITIESWVKPMTDILTVNPFMIILTKNLAYELDVNRVGGVVRSGIKSAVDGVRKISDSSKAGIVKMNEWNHVAMSYDGKTIKTFVNGVNSKQLKVAMLTPVMLRLAGLAEGGIGIMPNTQLITISGNGTSFPFRGVMDNLVFYPYTLSDQEIISHYTGTDIIDTDKDGIEDVLDNCPVNANADQLDTDKNGQGDVCDPCPLDFIDDVDGDKICSGTSFNSPMIGGGDNCQNISNVDQTDGDKDNFGNVCDVCPSDPGNDSDNDKICAGTGFFSPMIKDKDNCPVNNNSDQLDSDQDGLGDSCDLCKYDKNNDTDNDNICASLDNCPNNSNSNQSNLDNDSFGDVCDVCPNDVSNDIDRDGLCVDVDVCPFDPNNDQDNDGICANNDPCPSDSTNKCNEPKECVGPDCPPPPCEGVDCIKEPPVCEGADCDTKLPDVLDTIVNTYSGVSNFVNEVLENPKEIVNIVSEVVSDAVQNITDNILAVANTIMTDTKIAIEAVQVVIDNPEVEKINENYVAPTVVLAGATNVALGFQLPQILNLLRNFFAQPLLLLRRRKQKKWGVVYDSFTKKPVDLATVRVIKNGKVVKTQVTDSQGRYYLMLEPGDYTLEINKPGYDGFSDYLKKANEDAKYINLYHGESFKIDKEDTALNYNIPLDSTHQKTGLKEIIKDKTIKLSKFAISLAGLSVSGLSFIISPNALVSSFFFGHLLFFGITYKLAYTKVSGTFATIKDKTTQKPVDNVFVRIFDADYNKLVNTTTTDKKGRYAVLVGPSKYYVTFEKTGYKTIKSDVIDLSSQKTSGMGGMIEMGYEMEKT